ncbi:MAG: helix-turn-helix transcriptional regulator [Sarcina sp.]|nr:helix-turn-helix transcriptional regulator [Sarcina sp.]
MVDKVKQACAGKGITVTELEKLAGIPDNAIYKWDKHSPSVLTVARVAKVLGVTMDSLIDIPAEK